MPEVKSMFREVLPKQGEFFHCCGWVVLFSRLAFFVVHSFQNLTLIQTELKDVPHDTRNNRSTGIHSSALVRISLQTPSAWGVCCVLSVQVSCPRRTFPPWSCANPNSCLWSLWLWRNWRRCSRKRRRSSNNKSWLRRSSSSLREQSRAHFWGMKYTLPSQPNISTYH